MRVVRDVHVLRRPISLYDVVFVIEQRILFIPVVQSSTLSGGYNGGRRVCPPGAGMFFEMACGSGGFPGGLCPGSGEYPLIRHTCRSLDYYEATVENRQENGGGRSFLRGTYSYHRVGNLSELDGGQDFVPVTANLGINAYIGANPEADGLFFPPEHITWNQEAMFRDAKAIARMETKQSLKPSEVSAFWTRKVLSFAYHQPVAFLKLSAQKLAYAFYIREPMHDMEFAGLRPSIRIFKVLPVDLRFILPLGFLGMALSYRRFKELFVLYLAVVVLAYSLVFFFVTTRYRITYVPFMAVFAGAGIYGIGDFFRQRKNKQCLVACCAAAALFFLLNQNLPLEVQARHDAARERIVPAYTAQGFGYLLRGDYESALKKAQEAQVIKPRHYSGFLLEGNVYYSMGLFSKAEEWLKTTIERFPYCVYAYYLLGKMYNDRARFEDGHAVLEKALFLDEDYDDIYYEFGRSLEGLGDTSAAHRAFETALRKTSHYFYSSRVQIQNALSGISQ